MAVPWARFAIRIVALCAIGICCVAVVVFAISVWRRDPLLSVQPREVWMTTRDGPVPWGENGYFDYWYEIVKHQSDKANQYVKLQDYVFVLITNKRHAFDEEGARRLLKQSIIQCRSAFSDAYREGKLRRWPTNVNTKYGSTITPEFRAKYIVFLLGRAPEWNYKTISEEADYGVILSVDEVFDTNIDPAELAKQAKIMEHPNHQIPMGKTDTSGKSVLFMEYDIITEFEREKRENGVP